MNVNLIKRVLYNLGMKAKGKLYILIVSAVFLLVCFPLVFSLCSSLVSNTGIKGIKERNPVVKEALYLNSYARLKEKMTADKDSGKLPENEDVKIIFKIFLNNVISVQRFGKTIDVLSLDEKTDGTNNKDTGSKNTSIKNQKEVSAKAPVKSLADSKITLVSNANGNYEIFTSNPDGSGRQRLSENGKNNNFPRFSYDLKKIVFISDMDGTPEIYIINSDGSGFLKLTDNNGFNCFPGFSPDGTKIIFHSYQGESSEIYLMNVDGSGQERLTSNGTDEIEPCFSPDGKKIAFASDMDGDYEIYIMDLKSMDIFQVTYNDACDWEPSFSPDGSSLTFSSNKEGKYNIYVASITGKNARMVSGSFSNADNNNPYFSPDGKKIAFSSNIDGDFEVYTINMNTLETTKVTDNASEEWLYSWY
jgi:Tol biopolymer transport system component